MSQFEYASIAIALVYSFAIARLIGALPSALAADRRYWVHTVWVLVVLLAAASTWWSIWDLRAVAWTPFRFTWALSIPALIFVRAGILVSDDPGSIESWREHFFTRRLPFFGIGVLIALNGFVLPWIMDMVPWLVFTSVHGSAALLLVISLIGLVSARPELHAVLSVANLLMVATFMGVRSV